MERYQPGVGITAGSLMLKYEMINNHLSEHHDRPRAGDHVNIFINFESILRNLTMGTQVKPAITFHKQKVVIELEAAILNLMAHYRTYFLKEKCIPKVYFYHTELDFDTQQMSTYNKYYRSSYQNRYMQNPQTKMIGDIMNKIIIPEIELIISYIPNCYFLKSKTFDGSIIPLLVSKNWVMDNEPNPPNVKNIIITGDIFDTLYLFMDNFITIYIKRRYKDFHVISQVDQAVKSIIKGEDPFDLNIFNAPLYYRLLLSIKGSKIRNIRSAKGFGYGRFLKLIKGGMDTSVILKDFESLDSVIEYFPSKYKDDVKGAFQCTDVLTQYGLLSETDIDVIKSQVVDKYDITSLEALNNKRFLEFPINLQGLLEG